VEAGLKSLEELQKSTKVAGEVLPDAQKATSVALESNARNKASQVLKLMGNDLKDINIVGSTANGKLKPNDLDILITPQKSLGKLTSDKLYDRMDLQKVFEDELKPLFPDKKIHITISEYDASRSAKMSISNLESKIAPELQPLYHGTPEKFSKFDLSKQKITNEDFGKGVSFTEDPKLAKQYALGEDSNIRFNKDIITRDKGYIYHITTDKPIFNFDTSGKTIAELNKKAEKFAYKEELPLWRKETVSTGEEFYNKLKDHFGDSTNSVLEDLGFGGLRASKNEVRIFNPDNIKINKVEDIYNQATKKALPEAEQGLKAISTKTSELAPSTQIAENLIEKQKQVSQATQNLSRKVTSQSVPKVKSKISSYNDSITATIQNSQEAKDASTIFDIGQSKQIGTTKSIIRKTTGQVKDTELKLLNEQLRLQEQTSKKALSQGWDDAVAELKSIAEEKNFLASIKKDITEGIGQKMAKKQKEEDKLLQSIYDEIIGGIEKEKGAIRKQIGWQKHTNPEIKDNIIRRLKTEAGITGNWKEANI
jgi:hypothetical protein